MNNYLKEIQKKIIINLLFIDIIEMIITILKIKIMKF